MTEEYKRQPLPEWSEVLAEKDLEIKMLRTRLEVDERHPYDGIYCRDETIRLQDAEITRLTAEVERLRSLTVVQESLIRKSEAANEKLRAALERIADTDPDEGTQWFHEVATAALSGDKHE